MQLSVKDIADNANMIINGYAYTKDGDYIRVLNLNCLNNAAVIYKDKIVETNMDDIEIQIVLDYYNKNNRLPKILTFSLAALIAYYLKLGDREYELRDSAEVLEFFTSSPSVHDILSNTEFWGIDLTQINDFENTVSQYVEKIKNNGMKNAINEVVYE